MICVSSCVENITGVFTGSMDLCTNAAESDAALGVSQCAREGFSVGLGLCPPTHVPGPFAIALVLLSACDTCCIQEVDCYPVVPLPLKFRLFWSLGLYLFLAFCAGRKHLIYCN